MSTFALEDSSALKGATQMSTQRSLAILSLSLCLLALPLAVLGQPPADTPDRPRGGLFSEEAQGDGPLSISWFLFGLYVLVGLIFAGACAQQAVHKALSPLPWFFAGLFLNAVGYLILLTRPPGDARQFPAGIPGGLHKVPHTYEHQRCPCCGAYNHPAAYRCPACEAEMEPRMESEATRWRKQHPH